MNHGFWIAHIPISFSGISSLRGLIKHYELEVILWMD